MINRRGLGLLLCAGYALFAVLAVRDATHFLGNYVPAMPVIRAIAYCICAYFFFEIQRGKANASEKTMAYASGGVFIAKLTFLVGTMVHVRMSTLRALPWIVAALLVLAAISIAIRTVQLFQTRSAVQP